MTDRPRIIIYVTFSGVPRRAVGAGNDSAWHWPRATATGSASYGEGISDRGGAQASRRGGLYQGYSPTTLQHGTLADAARAIVAADLADTQDVTVVRERLQTSWARERWPKRSTRATFEIRDTTHDGGLYRSPRLCVGETSGKGVGELVSEAGRAGQSRRRLVRRAADGPRLPTCGKRS